MNSVEILKTAIRIRKPVEFRYNKEGKVRGKRIGNPHAIYIDPSTKNINTHVFQANGISDHPEDIPGWRTFVVRFIENTEILVNHPGFQVAKGYNPGFYINPIAKI